MRLHRGVRAPLYWAQFVFAGRDLELADLIYFEADGGSAPARFAPPDQVLVAEGLAYHLRRGPAFEARAPQDKRSVRLGERYWAAGRNGYVYCHSDEAPVLALVRGAP